MAIAYLGRMAPWKKPNNSSNVTYDNSGTAKIANGDSSVTITCGFLTDKSIVIIIPVDAAAGEIPLIEAAYDGSGDLQRTTGTNGTFVVALQDASAAGADLLFNWVVINI